MPNFVVHVFTSSLLWCDAAPASDALSSKTWWGRVGPPLPRLIPSQGTAWALVGAQCCPTPTTDWVALGQGTTTLGSDCPQA